MLYNDERPLDFGSLEGQEHNVAVFKGQFKSGKIPHAILLSGVRGTGKTTTARIITRLINCEHPTENGPCNVCENCRKILAGESIDIFEIDAASNNGVDDMRRLNDLTITVPMLKYKTFLIDEAHMLSPSAFNALLKTLEEPPKNVVIILATTEEWKIPITIRSRCQIFRYRAIDEMTIANKLCEVCDKHNKTYELPALYLIAKAATGAMRDALSLLDGCFFLDHITTEFVQNKLGIADEDTLFKIVSGLMTQNAIDCINGVEDIADTGRSMGLLVTDIINVLLDIVISKQASVDSIYNTASYKAHISSLSNTCDIDTIFHYISELGDLRERIQREINPKISVKTTLLKLIHESSKENKIISMEKRFEELRQQLENVAINSTNTTCSQLNANNSEIANAYSEDVVVLVNNINTPMDEQTIEQCKNRLIGRIEKVSEMEQSKDTGSDIEQTVEHEANLSEPGNSTIMDESGRPPLSSLVGGNILVMGEDLQNAVPGNQAAASSVNNAEASSKAGDDLREQTVIEQKDSVIESDESAFQDFNWLFSN